MKFLPTTPEFSGNLGNLYIRQDLLNHAVTIYLKDLEKWNPDTEQIRISKNLIHFVQPRDQLIVGIKVFGSGK